MFYKLYAMIILPLTYLPSIEWFAYLIQNNEIILEKQENYIKQSFRSRTRILSPNGTQTLSVPVIGGRKNNKLYNQIEIDYSHSWVAKHLNSIKTAYGSAPYFDFIFYDLAQILKSKTAKLFDLNLKLLQYICDFLTIDFTKISFTERYYQNYDTSTIDKRNLANKNVNMLIMPPYPQVFSDRFSFVPNLSILDLIFNLGPEAIIYLKQLKV